MNGTPARPESQETRGEQPQSRRNPRWARIVNPVLNQSPVIRRKDADRLVSLGRADWVASDQLRLMLSHPANLDAIDKASKGYNDIDPKRFVFSGRSRKPTPSMPPKGALRPFVKTNKHTNCGRVGSVPRLGGLM
jgi:hypothetical protein